MCNLRVIYVRFSIDLRLFDHSPVLLVNDTCTWTKLMLSLWGERLEKNWGGRGRYNHVNEYFIGVGRILHYFVISAHL